MIQKFFERVRALQEKHQMLILVISSFAIVLFWSAADCLMKRMFCLEESIVMAVVAMITAYAIVIGMHKTIG